MRWRAHDQRSPAAFASQTGAVKATQLYLQNRADSGERKTPKKIVGVNPERHGPYYLPNKLNRLVASRMSAVALKE